MHKHYSLSLCPKQKHVSVFYVFWSATEGSATTHMWRKPHFPFLASCYLATASTQGGTNIDDAKVQIGQKTSGEKEPKSG